MSLPYLYSTPQTADDWKKWSWNHAANHYEIVAAANTKFNTVEILTTTEASAAGATVLQFAAVPPSVGQSSVVLGVVDLSADVIPTGTTMIAYNTTQVELSADITGAGVGLGDSIQFAPASPVDLQQFILDPMNPNNLGLWLYWHQLMHAQADALLGIEGYDLLGLDWDDPQQFSEWLRLNGDEHTRICALLGVG